MPKKKTPELPPKKQFERFMETVRKFGVDETGKEFELVFNKVAHHGRDNKTEGPVKPALKSRRAADYEDDP